MESSIIFETRNKISGIIDVDMGKLMLEILGLNSWGD